MRPQARVRPAAHNQPLGELVENVIEILDYERVPVAPPPVADHPIREHDHVPRMLLPVDDHPAEAVLLDSCHGDGS